MVRRRRTPQTQRWIRWGAAAVLTFLLVWVAMTWGDREELPHGSGPQAMPGEEDSPGAEEPPAATDPESARDSPRERGEPTMEPARGDDGASDGEPESSVLSTEPDPERIAELTRAVERSQIEDQVEPEARARLNETDPEEDDEGDAPDSTGTSDDSDSGALTQDEEERREALQALIEEEEVDDLETLEALASERGIALTEDEAMLEEQALAAELEDELEAEVDALLYGDEAAVEPIAGEEVAATGSEATLGGEAAAGGEEALGAGTAGDWEGAVAGMTPAGALAQLGGATPEQVAANAAGYAWASTSALVLALEALRLALADQGTPARVVTRSEAEDDDEEDERPDADDADSDDEESDDREDGEGEGRDGEDDAFAGDDRRPDEILPVEEATLIWAAWSRGVTELRRTQERFYPGLAWMRVEVEEAFEALSPGMPLSEQTEALVELVERAGALLQAMEDAEVLGGAPSPI